MTTAWKTSKCDRWYTPPDLLADIAAFLGGDFVDPCPESQPGKAIVNGLALPWSGRVYCNPPYGHAIRAWVIKAMTEPVDELVLLVPARTDTGWFQTLYDWPICFLRGRLQYGGYIKDNAPFASALVYRGERVDEFCSAFRQRGNIMRRIWRKCESCEQERERGQHDTGHDEDHDHSR